MSGRAGEWLLTNGLGGYALGPRAGGEPPRGYHGLLVAATQPPDGRVLLVGGMEVTLVDEAGERRLHALELVPAGSASGVTVTARMLDRANATVLACTIDGSPGSTRAVRLAPRLAGRDHHPADGRSTAPADVTIDDATRTVTVRWADPAMPDLTMAASDGTWRRVDRTAAVTWPEEIARGTATGETLHVPVELEVTAPASVTLVLGTAAGSLAAIPSPGPAGTGPTPEASADEPLAPATHLDALRAAAAHFLVHRPDPRAADPSAGVTIIAGYPWFGDWGRDTAISLPGLTLATGRHQDAARILRTWAGLVRDGLLPNHFPEAGTPAYHAIDAPLWFVHAVGAYEDATGDPDGLVRELRPAWQAILDAYATGTRFGIGLDGDGLVRGGEPGLQLTWMDAKVDGVVMTPRHGKPVEIAALWIAANERAARWLDEAGDGAGAARCGDRADRARASFAARYPRADGAWLNDVVDGPDGDDSSLRPNQLVALALVADLVPAAVASAALDACAAQLVVPGGVRTLAPFEPGYRDRFQGPPAFRDSAYHQGPAWTWLLGSWIEALARVRGVDAARAELERHLAALDPDRTGGIPELLEPEPPFAPRGCPWQAWGTAELLRVATLLAADASARGA